jgi:two-component system, OmpR family, sensor kinase
VKSGPSRRPRLRTRVMVGVLAVTLAALAAFDVAAVAALRGYLIGRTDSQLQDVLGLYRPLLGPGKELQWSREVARARGAVLLSGRHGTERTRVPARCDAAMVPVAATRAKPSGKPELVPKPGTPFPKQGTPFPKQGTIAGPRVQVAAPILEQYYVGFATHAGHRPTLSGLGPASAPRASVPWDRVSRDAVAVSGLVQGDPSLTPRLPANLAAVAAHRAAITVPSRNGNTQLRLLAVNEAGGTLVATTSLAGVTRTTGQLELILVIGSAAAALLAGLGATLVMRRGLRPIEAMAVQADAITAGDLTDRVGPDDARTEVGRLGAALNGMLARIDAAIGEREASQRATRRFFADASHELRTPLASLRANAELYQQGALRDGPQVGEAMRRIALEAQRMSSLVDDMLRLARLDQPGVPTEGRHDPVDLTRLVAECAARAQVADPQRSWHTEIAQDLAAVGDEELLRRALDNVLANVSGHTPAGTVATITAARHDGDVVIEVSDDGPGVPDESLPRIFERFYRATAPSQRPGSGLGLAIVAAIATAHHGTAGATANRPHGLCVMLTLPAP